MTKPITDASTAVAEAIANKFMFGDGYTSGIYATVSYRIIYDGANWVVSSVYGTKQSYADISVAWDNVDYKLDIDLSALDNAFTGAPTVQVTPLAGSTDAAGLNYMAQARVPWTSSNAYVRFIDMATPNDYVQTESTKMAFFITFIGYIG